MWYCAPDYVRLTVPRSDELFDVAIEQYRKLVLLVGRRWYGENASTERWAWQGYHGAACNDVKFGERDDGALLQASGRLSESVRDNGGPHYTNVARLDIALTLWYDEYLPDLARGVALWSDRLAQSAKHRPWAVELRDTFGRGDTLYIGSRQSDVFIRFYDKDKQQNALGPGKADPEGYKNAWRLEVELKGECAIPAWECDRFAFPTPEAWLARLQAYAYKRGVWLPDLAPVYRIAPDRVPKPKPDGASRMHWLRSQVRPSIERLKREGFTDEELQAVLGLGVSRETPIRSTKRYKVEM